MLHDNAPINMVIIRRRDTSVFIPGDYRKYCGMSCLASTCPRRHLIFTCSWLYTTHTHGTTTHVAVPSYTYTVPYYHRVPQHTRYGTTHVAQSDAGIPIHPMANMLIKNKLNGDYNNFVSDKFLDTAEFMINKYIFKLISSTDVQITKL